MILQRIKSPPDRTDGYLTLPDGTELKTLELPWRHNQVGKSCIPAGHYFIVRDNHGKHQWWRVLDVEGRTAIEIHEGSKPNHSQGCILMTKGALRAMDEFYGEYGVKYPLEIRDYVASNN